MTTYTCYHGTGESFESFDLAYGGENTGYAGADKAVFLAKYRCDSDLYATMAAERTGLYVMLTCEVEVTNPLVIDDDDHPFLNDDDAALDYAAANGHDAVIWPGGNANNSDWTIAVRCPDQIRIVSRTEKAA